MVVDVYRIKKKKGAKGQEEDGNYMQRFSGTPSLPPFLP
jgi:hypothetical protein